MVSELFPGSVVAFSEKFRGRSGGYGTASVRFRSVLIAIAKYFRGVLGGILMQFPLCSEQFLGTLGMFM